MPQLTARPAQGRVPTAPPRPLRPTLLGLALGLGVLLSACTSTAAPSDADSGTVIPAAGGASTQTSEGGQVTVVVAWPGPSAGPIFTVTMDTHAVDLDGYDLTQLAVLRTASGREVRPLSWDAPKGGHHRSGPLAFPTSTPDGTPLLGPDAGRVELLIRGVAGVPERSFRWDR